MPEDQSAENQGEQAPKDESQGESSGYTPPATQADLDRIISDRVSRERAKFSDYKDLRVKAQQYDQLQDESKSEAQKLTDRIAALEQENSKAQVELVKRRVQARFGIEDEDADLFLTGTDEESLTRQAQRLSDRATKSAASGNVVPREGANQQPTLSTDREAVKALFGR